MQVGMFVISRIQNVESSRSKYFFQVLVSVRCFVPVFSAKVKIICADKLSNFEVLDQ